MPIIESHPIPPFLPSKVDFLIVGSFPPIRLTEKQEHPDGIDEGHYDNPNFQFDDNNDISFYYGSRDNLFWDLLSDAFDQDLGDVEAIRAFLRNSNIGITDVHQSVVRIVRNEKITSKDQDLFELVERQVPIDELPVLQRIFTTSQYVTGIIVQRHPDLQIPVTTLISPSPTGSRAIGRTDSYKEMKRNGEVADTYDYRLIKYTEAFQEAGLL